MYTKHSNNYIVIQIKPPNCRVFQVPSLYLVQGEGDVGKIEYRVWNPFRSKLAAAILGGVDKIHIQPGTKVLYLGAASGTTVSHVADIVGPVRCKTSRIV